MDTLEIVLLTLFNTMQRANDDIWSNIYNYNIQWHNLGWILGDGKENTIFENVIEGAANLL